MASIDPTDLTVEDAAKALTAAGARRVAPEDLRADIDAGAPVNAAGRINLVHYAAWLLRGVAQRPDQPE